MFIQCYAHMIYIYIPFTSGFSQYFTSSFSHRSIADWFELTQSISHFQITWGSSSHFVCCQVELVSPYHFHRETLSSWKIWLGLSISLRWRRSRSNSYLLTTGMHAMLQVSSQVMLFLKSETLLQRSRKYIIFKLRCIGSEQKLRLTQCEAPQWCERWFIQIRPSN